ENLWGCLLDHRVDLARAVGDDRWLALGIEHSRFYQPGERPRTTARAPDEEEVIEDAVMTRVLSVAGELGRDVSDGGAGDEQAGRMVLLLAKTGRRGMEILPLDFDPPPARQSRTTGRPDAHAPLPPHPGDIPDQRRRAAARRAALLRTPVSDHDDALRPHPGRDPRARVPALPQDHRGRPPAGCRPARSVRHARARQARRPDPPERLLPAAAPPELRPRQREIGRASC